MAIQTLNVLLHEEPIGTLALLPGERTLFAFNDEYVENEQRSTLSLSFKDAYGGLNTEIPPTNTRLPPFFSNLLPEGHLRAYLAERANVNTEREFSLIRALGKDLPGAITVSTDENAGLGGEYEAVAGQRLPDDVLRFSLAGVQLKFSALNEASGGLSIPARGQGGDWIIKLPSSRFEGVPENEFSMMQFASMLGIDVPDTQLVAIRDIAGLPKDVEALGDTAFAIKRFDRHDSGERVHSEDFAQVFGVRPQDKYEKASYRNLAEVLWLETGEAGIVEFVKRIVFNALIGNSDMHLKNWSLIYPDRRHAALAPAYDFVSTTSYLADENMSLSLAGHGTKAYASLSAEAFARFADKAKLPETIVIQTAKEMAQRFIEGWPKAQADLPVSARTIEAIQQQIRKIPLMSEL